MNAATIQLHNLSIGYHHKQQVHPIATELNATLHSGQLTCLLGANGVGKSTLLRTLSAFLPPLEGEITLLGKPLESYNDKALARTLSVVLTERIDVPDLHVADTVALGRTPYTGFLGRLTPIDQHHIEAAMQATGITPLAHRELHTLSDGERQKTMIAKALAQDTPIIFLDEPTAFLDYPSKVEMMQLLHRLSRTMQKTIFLSTHDLDLALQLADCVWLLDEQGHLTTGLPESLILDGTLLHFFQSDGVYFDSTTGHFTVHHRPLPYSPVILTGTGLPRLMVQRALQRQGFTLLDAPTTTEEQPTRAEEKALILTATQDTNGAPCFVLASNTSAVPLHFSSIEALLEALKAITNAAPSPTIPYSKP